MPDVIDIPEIIEKVQEGPSCDTLEITLSLNPAVVNKITHLLVGTATRLRTAHHDADESVIDILARQHPYIYIKALAG